MFNPHSLGRSGRTTGIHDTTALGTDTCLSANSLHSSICIEAAQHKDCLMEDVDLIYRLPKRCTKHLQIPFPSILSKEKQVMAEGMDALYTLIR